MFDKGVLSMIFGSKKAGENCIMRSVMICTSYQVFIILVVKSRRMRGAGHVAQMVQSEMHPRFWWGT